MTKERILAMIEKLLKIYEELDENKSEDDNELELNNLVEFVWEDEHWNWLYRFKD